MLQVAPFPKVTSWSKMSAAAPAIMSIFLLARGRKERGRMRLHFNLRKLRIQHTFHWPKLSLMSTFN